MVTRVTNQQRLIFVKQWADSFSLLLNHFFSPAALNKALPILTDWGTRQQGQECS